MSDVAPEEPPNPDVIHAFRWGNSKADCRRCGLETKYRANSNGERIYFVGGRWTTEAPMVCQEPVRSQP